MIRGVLLALLLAGVAAAPAQAGARADAKRLAGIVDAMHDAIPVAEARELGERLDSEMESCPAQPPENWAGAYRTVSLYQRHSVAAFHEHLSRAGQRLQSLRTRDRKLRGLARAMGRSLLGVLPLGETPPAPCGYYEAWKAAGWSSGFRIDPPVRNLSEGEVAALVRDSRAIARSLRRLRELGVSRGRVESLRDAFVADADLYPHLQL